MFCCDCIITESSCGKASYWKTDNTPGRYSVLYGFIGLLPRGQGEIPVHCAGAGR